VAIFVTIELEPLTAVVAVLAQFVTVLVYLTLRQSLFEPLRSV